MQEYLKAVLFGIVEGITEWLPISSTGHLILLEEFVHLRVSSDFYELFQVVIQLGAILAVVFLFFHKLNPFSPRKTEQEQKETWKLWLKVIVAVLPSAVLGLLFDELLEENLYNYAVVTIMLIVYGLAFVLVEIRNIGRNFTIAGVYDIDYRTALLIGVFQCLSLIPGTSRSGATILGAILLGVSRPAGAEFSFFLAIPTMLGASCLKLFKYLLAGNFPSGNELMILLIGCAVSFAVSLLVIRALMEYVRKHSFTGFGIYRIALGVTVMLYFVLQG